MIDTNHFDNFPFGYPDPGLHAQWLESAQERLKLSSKAELLNLIAKERKLIGKSKIISYKEYILFTNI